MNTGQLIIITLGLIAIGYGIYLLKTKKQSPHKEK